MEGIRYPLGKFAAQENYSSEDITGFIKKIEELPAKLEKAVQNLNDEQLDTPYREGGWSVRQVVHHLADSHMHATSAQNGPSLKTSRSSKHISRSFGPKPQKQNHTQMSRFHF